MDMIRWLATNKVVVTVWGLGILAILLASIFGGGKKETEQPTAAVETKVVETAAVATETVKPATASVAAAATVATAAVASTVQSAVDTTAEASTDAVKEANAETAVDVKEVSAETEAAVVTEADNSEESTGESQEAATATASASTEAATEQASAVKEDDLSDKSSDDLLMMAREAYWDNGLDKAASLYSELITREPKVIEHKGELGNVFWRQGYPKKAAELYADIAEPMITEGNGERVSNMVGFIGLFFPERAATIRKLLDAQ